MADVRTCADALRTSHSLQQQVPTTATSSGQVFLVNVAQVEVVDPVEDYLAVLKEVFDFPAIKALVSRSDFSLVFDALHAVTGAYAGPIFVSELGASPDSVR